MGFLGTSDFLYQAFSALLSKHLAEHTSCSSSRIHGTETANAADILAFLFFTECIFLFTERNKSAFLKTIIFPGRKMESN